MKKWLVGALIVGFVGVLIVGAVIRTMDKTEQASSAQGEGIGRSADRLSGRGNGAGESLNPLQRDAARAQNLESKLGNGRQYAESVNDLQGDGRRYGQSLDSRPGGSEMAGDSIGVPQAQVDEWVVLEGVVADIVDEGLIIEQSDGSELIVEGRAWSYAQELGFETKIGSQVSLVGFYEGDDFEVGTIIDESTGSEVVLREPNGRPLWAGNGRRGAYG